ncbi:Methyltransferase [Fulvivirga imtechensis AK7]|uniref:Methyltransferase n=1 Tax=Fulvivirga imtechensis AK7 TaxID=1237149 RepID=L8JSV4_9BACT|nr:class I SAM-dependent methyltransferase [Fulvivirga imtechensis]ELR71935.1 Methyltransferase [Fulvivirga imtechensis AK7]
MIISQSEATSGEENGGSTYPMIFQSKIKALRQMLPVVKGRGLEGLELPLGYNVFINALNIPKSGKKASKMNRKIRTVKPLPFTENQFDFIVNVCCINNFNDLHVTFEEAHRVLKPNGVLVLGFIDRQHSMGQQYATHLPLIPFYRQINIYAVEKVVFELSRAWFNEFSFCQTLFHLPDQITTVESPQPGYGEGAFVVVRAKKKDML